MSNSIVYQNGDNLTVSTSVLADGMELEHRQVIRSVRENLDDLERFGRVDFQSQPFATAGGTQVREIAHLTEPQATFLLTSFRNIGRVKEFKVKLVHEFYRMRQALMFAPPQPFSLPQSFSEALRELATTVEQNAALEAKVAEDAPKVEYVDTFVASEDLRLMRNVAKSLGLSETELRDALLTHHWIYKEEIERWSNTQGKKMPVKRYSPVADKRAYFRPVPVHDAPRFKGEVMHTLKVTPQGASAIARAAQSWGIVGGIAA